jgi:Kef-type K+ transport system membrane component KefB
MDELSKILLTIGGLMLIGLATDALGRRTPLPRVTMLLLFGFLIGPSVLDLLPANSIDWFPVIAEMALLMVGFLLGEKLAFSLLRVNGRQVMWISLAVVLVTGVLVIMGLLFFEVPLSIALVLGAIATATAPAATVDVVRETGAKGPFSNILLGIVAIDDAWGLIVFSILLAVAYALQGSEEAVNALLSGVWDLLGAILLGLFLGVPMAYLTGRIRPGEPILAEALGMVFVCGGIAQWLDVSFLLAAMVMGAVVANLARHHQRPFHEIKHIEWPFIILFFVLAGSSMNIQAFSGVGLIGIAYIALRIAGRVIGVWLGCRACDASKQVRRWMGLALLPQAGVAMGMALVASQRLPDIADQLLTIVIGATIFFELVGPVFTRLALRHAGETHQ